jgi:phospholipid/cholesterol/gamma-HCH transport system permease protein
LVWAVTLICLFKYCARTYQKSGKKNKNNSVLLHGSKIPIHIFTLNCLWVSFFQLLTAGFNVIFEAMNFLYHLGRYFMLLGKVFTKPEKASIYWNLIIDEIYELGIGSLGITAIISLFMGAVITIQTAANIEGSWVPAYTVGYTTREAVIKEFSPTIIALILAGKIGSNIASKIGSMRVTEQIDALVIMGVNAPGYLILPKIVAAVFILPFLVVISMFLGVSSGYLVSLYSGLLDPSEYIYGISYDFIPFSVTYALIKTLFFAFAITSIPAYHGFYTSGGALEVGKSSTQAVVYSSIVVLLLNYVITQLLLI